MDTVRILYHACYTPMKIDLLAFLHVSSSMLEYNATALVITNQLGRFIQTAMKSKKTKNGQSEWK